MSKEFIHIQTTSLVSMYYIFTAAQARKVPVIIIETIVNIIVLK